MRRAPGWIAQRFRPKSSALLAELKSTSESAVFSGENWLQGDSTGPTTKTIVASFSRDSTGAVAIGTIEVDVGPAGTMMYDTSGSAAGIMDQVRTPPSGGADYTIATLDISTITDDPDDLTMLEEIVDGVDAAIGSMTDAATLLGAAKSRITLQKDFVQKLLDAIDTGVGQLVDADAERRIDAACRLCRCASNLVCRRSVSPTSPLSRSCGCSRASRLRYQAGFKASKPRHTAWLFYFISFHPLAHPSGGNSRTSLVAQNPFGIISPRCFDFR